MKLLFDENLSRRLVGALESEFPDSSHLDLHGIQGASDAVVWTFAREHGFTIVSRDNDFRQRAFVYGPPPKVIWLSVRNAGTGRISKLLRSSALKIGNFIGDPDEALLVLELPQEEV